MSTQVPATALQLGEPASGAGVPFAGCISSPGATFAS
jgi:hypothetical protein